MFESYKIRNCRTLFFGKVQTDLILNCQLEIKDQMRQKVTVEIFDMKSNNSNNKEVPNEYATTNCIYTLSHLSAHVVNRLLRENRKSITKIVNC